MKQKMNLMKLSKDAMKDVKAGYTVYGDQYHICGCGCYYAGGGGSSSSGNLGANYRDDLYSPIQ